MYRLTRKSRPHEIYQDRRPLLLQDLVDNARLRSVQHCMIKGADVLPFKIPDKFKFAAAVVLKAPKAVVAKVLSDNRIPYQTRWTKAYLVELLFNSM